MTARQLAETRLADTKRNSLIPITARLRMRALTTAMAFASALIWVWVIEFFAWHRLGRLSTVVRQSTTFGPFIAILGVLLWLEQGAGGISLSSVLTGGLLLLSRHLPANPVALATVAGGLYWRCATPLTAKRPRPRIHKRRGRHEPTFSQRAHKLVPITLHARSRQCQARIVSGLATQATLSRALHPTPLADLRKCAPLGILEAPPYWPVGAQNSVLRKPSTHLG